MDNSFSLYRCEVCNYYTNKEPSCIDCHTRSCPYNRGLSEHPCIMVKDVAVDEEGFILSETPERPLYPKCK